MAVIAGTEQWWQNVENQWIVRCGGIPFHATDCESNQGDYKNIPKEENRRCIVVLGLREGVCTGNGWSSFTSSFFRPARPNCCRCVNVDIKREPDLERKVNEGIDVP